MTGFKTRNIIILLVSSITAVHSMHAMFVVAFLVHFCETHKHLSTDFFEKHYVYWKVITRFFECRRKARSLNYFTRPHVPSIHDHKFSCFEGWNFTTKIRKASMVSYRYCIDRKIGQKSNASSCAILVLILESQTADRMRWR